MRSNIVLSLFLTFLTALTGLTTLCPEGEGQGYSVHFIAENCDTHECTSGADHNSCRSDGCDHGVCGDVDVGVHYYPVQQFHFESIPAPSRFFAEDYSARGSAIPVSPELHSGIVNLQRSSVLRI